MTWNTVQAKRPNIQKLVAKSMHVELTLASSRLK
jgi:hypothetical protein